MIVVGSDENDTAQGIHQFLVTLVKDRVLPGDENEELLNVSSDSTEVGGDSASEHSETSKPFGVFDDSHHGGLLRSMALRVLANALTVLLNTMAYSSRACSRHRLSVLAR